MGTSGRQSGRDLWKEGSENNDSFIERAQLSYPIALGRIFAMFPPNWYYNQMSSFRINYEHTKRDAIFLIILLASLGGYYVYLRTNFILVSTSSDIPEVARTIADKNNPMLCKNIRTVSLFGPTEAEHQSNCFQTVAKLLQDGSLCEYTSYKEACKLEVKCRGSHCLLGY